MPSVNASAEIVVVVCVLLLIYIGVDVVLKGYLNEQVCYYMDKGYAYIVPSESFDNPSPVHYAGTSTLALTSGSIRTDAVEDPRGYGGGVNSTNYGIENRTFWDGNNLTELIDVNSIGPASLNSVDSKNVKNAVNATMAKLEGVSNSPKQKNTFNAFVRGQALDPY